MGLLIRQRLCWLLAAGLLCCPATSWAAATVAVATNFAETAQRLQAAFRAVGGGEITLVNGSTGKLYAQILQGAPFDLFLAADTRRPALLEQQQLGVTGSRATYAYGALVLWQPDARAVKATPLKTLQAQSFRRLAIANPELAPYGAAAEQTLQQLGLLVPLQSRIVRGQNIGQTFAMVASGNAELGFIAAAQVSEHERTNGSFWPVPTRYHEPIEQQLVLLQRGAQNTAATAFAAFLLGATAQQLIQSDGYAVPPNLVNQRSRDAS